MRKKPTESGLSLIEVMIALAILASSLFILISSSASNIAETQRMRLLGVASNLARAKIYDLEETLEKDGFQQTDQSENGTFEEEGWPDIKWEAQIEKVEIPGLPALGQLGAGGEDSEGDSDAPGAGLLGGLLDSFGGGDAAAGAGGLAGAASAGFITSQFELVKNVLEESIRKTTLTVTWKVLGYEENLVLSVYFTDPAAVTRRGGGPGTTDAPPAGGGT